MPGGVGKAAKRPKKRSKPDTKRGSGSHDSAADSGSESEHPDPESEEWEAAVGIYRGLISTWDSQHEAPLEEEDMVDIAYAPGSLQTRDVPGSSFRYAKILSTPFLGAGIVDLPPGGAKRPKNSRKMHMAFYVAKGRVTVNVGPSSNDKQSRFSIGRGGFWHVPRGWSPTHLTIFSLTDIKGNQYSIENELDRPARIFFSQGTETVSEMVN